MTKDLYDNNALKVHTLIEEDTQETHTAVVEALKTRNVTN
jgi:hypothetical protein